MIDFWISGTPATKGSAKAFVVKGRAIVTNDAGAKAKVWASVVADAARGAMGEQPLLVGPVRLEIVFYLPRPQAHRRSNGALKPNAPVHVAKKPDASKLLRCAEDALTGVCFTDDAQVAVLVGEKRYADEGRVGARIRVAPIEPVQPQLGLGVVTAAEAR